MSVTPRKLGPVDRLVAGTHDAEPGDLVAVGLVVRLLLDDMRPVRRGHREAVPHACTRTHLAGLDLEHLGDPVVRAEPVAEHRVVDRTARVVRLPEARRRQGAEVDVGREHRRERLAVLRGQRGDELLAHRRSGPHGVLLRGSHGGRRWPPARSTTAETRSPEPGVPDRGPGRIPHDAPTCRPGRPVGVDRRRLDGRDTQETLGPLRSVHPARTCLRPRLLARSGAGDAPRGGSVDAGLTIRACRRGSGRQGPRVTTFYRRVLDESPVPVADALGRPRLLTIVQGRWTRPVTAVVAGAGFGKTTLLAQAVRENRLARDGVDVHLRLEAADASAARLAARLLAQFGTEPPRACRRRRAL